MPSYSIFALGTLESLKTERSIITQFYHTCQRPKLILDGLHNIFNFARIEDNVNFAVKNIVKWLTTEAVSDIDLASNQYRINLAGYSRGAVTCLRVANRLYKYLQKNKIKNKKGEIISLEKIKLNIFGIDPVAGIFEKRDQEARDVPPIVENYIATLQMHDYRKDFAPQDLSRTRVLDSSKTRVTFLPMYGYHSAGTKIMDPKLFHTAEISWQLLYRFFKSNGTEFCSVPAIANIRNELRTNHELSDIQLLNLFAHTRKHKKQYEDSSEWGFSLSGQRHRSFTERLDHYVEDSDFFINQVERDLFKKCYPKVFSYFFKNNANNETSLREEVIEELKKMHSVSPLVFQWLKQKGVSRTDTGGITLPLIVGGVFDNGKYLIKSLITDAILQLYYYHRSKSEWMAFSVGNEHGRALEIEAAIKIIKNTPLIPAEKAKQILDLIEYHYCDLHQSNSANKLKYLLEDVLYKYGRVYSKDIYNVSGTHKAMRVIGAGLKMLGEGLKNIGRAVAFAIGASGVFLDGLGNCLMYTRILWIPGKIISLMGRAGKLLAANVLSPALEAVGNVTRWLGKCLVKASGMFRKPMLRSHEKESNDKKPCLGEHNKMNPALQKILLRQVSQNKKVLVDMPDDKPVISPVKKPAVLFSFVRENVDKIAGNDTGTAGSPLKFV